INGLLDPVNRADAFERVANGSATLLYISPEMLRSKTIEKLLLSRNIVRFVVDEAHCFSSWGQDFRVDYLYIGDFIKKLQEKKNQPQTIPVSCFTATAKQKVITDICDYFNKKLGLNLKIFASSSERKNLHYSVIYSETEDDKYNKLRELMLSNPCPTIIYVSRTRKTIELAEKLTSDGLKTLPFNGKMDSNDKIANQNQFIANEVRAMVATSAFGMGVDKKDVGMVIHYDISDSLENYVQEAGRAGRDPRASAKCYVLYSDHDLDKHFILLNQTKVSISEIQQVWKTIKDFTRKREYVCCSPLEIARQAGWNEDVADIETRVRTCVAALEDAGYVSRGNNVPHVFATGIMVKNMDEARQRITQSSLFANDRERQNAARIIKSLISKKYVSESVGDDAESRVDYLADILGMSKESVIGAVSTMRQEGVLADSSDMSAFIDTSEKQSVKVFENFAKLERFILTQIAEKETEFSYKAINELAQSNGLLSNIKNIRVLLYFLAVKSYIRKKESPRNGIVKVVLTQPLEQTILKHDRRVSICKYIIGQLYAQAEQKPHPDKQSVLVQFSVTSLLKGYLNEQKNNLFQNEGDCSISDIEDALLYLSKIGAMKLEGGFLVIYNAMEIHRLADMRYGYKREDYRMLDEFYKQKIRQIHIVGEYANLMVRDYDAALQYVQDYFQMDFKKFIST
ncbi:MAG: ATP-dependent DNA helicase RecQ, partial [Bacteroidales bacterium]|nr:ATP-dependent DNA helicase RecQ [Bacteroidales bacterium]